MTTTAESESPRDLVRQVRSLCVPSLSSALAEWFLLFERHLAAGDYLVCEALLSEVRNEDYGLSGLERKFVTAHEAALALGQAVAALEAGHDRQAGELCQRSYDLHRSVRHREGQGQAGLLLHSLGTERARDKTLLEGIRRGLRVLGGAERMLAERVQSLNAAGCREALWAAWSRKQPLAALPLFGSTRAESLRTLAAGVVGHFRNVPAPREVLLRGLSDRNWFVRWRCARTLEDPQHGGGEVLAALRAALQAESDPEVRRTLCETLRQRGDRTATPELVEASADPDVEVRSAAVEALGQVGDRRALEPLRAVPGGLDLVRREVRERAAAAVRAIEARFPAPGLRRVQLRRQAGTEAAAESGRFQSSDVIVWSAVVEGDVPADAVVRVRCWHPSGELLAEQALDLGLGGSLGPEPLLSSSELSARSAALQPGVRVRCVRDGAGGNARLRRGDEGVVRGRVAASPPLGVAWERDIGGGALEAVGGCAAGHGWFVGVADVALASEPPRAGVGVCFSPPGGWVAESYYTVEAVLRISGIEERAVRGTFRVGSLWVPADLVEVADAELASVSGLASGSAEAQARQLAEGAASCLPVEVVIAEIDLRLRLVPADRFQMGSPPEEQEAMRRAGAEAEWVAREGPRHWVTLTSGFYAGKYPVTQGQWRAVMETEPWHFRQAGSDAPMENVSWDECQEFCRRLCRRLGVAEGTYRLLTEAEWEYACRAGTETALYSGPIEVLGKCNAPTLDPIAWYSGNSGVSYEGGWDSSSWPERQNDHRRAGTHAVGGKVPNAFGLYDMIGNVWEWCRDVYGPYSPTEAVDPIGAEASAGGGVRRVYRGGGWYTIAVFCRAARRDWGVPGFRVAFLGFRLARQLPSER